MDEDRIGLILAYCLSELEIRMDGWMDGWRYGWRYGWIYVPKPKENASSREEGGKMHNAC